MNLRYYLILSLLLPLMATAQGKTKFGVNAGATLSNFTGDSSEGFKYGFDFLVGFGLETPLNDNFSLLANVNYERKTPKTSFVDEFSGNYDPITGVYNYDEIPAKVRIHYITIPVNVKYYFGAQKNFFVQAGPYAGFFIDDTFFVDGKEQTMETAGGSDFKLLDLGLSSGVGVQFKTDEKHHISLSLRNNLGLTNISDMSGQTIKMNTFNFVFTWESNM